MASQMDKEKREMEMAIAKSLVDQQRLQTEKKAQEDILEHQMKNLSMNEPTTSAGKSTLEIDKLIFNLMIQRRC